MDERWREANAGNLKYGDLKIIKSFEKTKSLDSASILDSLKEKLDDLRDNEKLFDNMKRGIDIITWVGASVAIFLAIKYLSYPIIQSVKIKDFFHLVNDAGKESCRFFPPKPRSELCSSEGLNKLGEAVGWVLAPIIGAFFFKDNADKFLNWLFGRSSDGKGGQ